MYATLARGSVHVWRADLDDDLARDRAHLISADERARAGRIQSRRRAYRWARARGILRELLAHYLHAEPRSLGFSVDAHGKPSLSAPCQLRFNISHSRSLALYAFALGSAVGVDIEVARTATGRTGTSDLARLAERAIGEHEALRLRGCPPSAREREFLRGWTRYEAAAKCSGSGIAATARARNSSSTRTAKPPWVCELDLAPDIAAAIAVAQEPHELSLWDWNAAVRGDLCAAAADARTCPRGERPLLPFLRL